MPRHMFVCCGAHGLAPALLCIGAEPARRRRDHRPRARQRIRRASGRVRLAGACARLLAAWALARHWHGTGPTCTGCGAQRREIERLRELHAIWRQNSDLLLAEQEKTKLLRQTVRSLEADIARLHRVATGCNMLQQAATCCNSAAPDRVHAGTARRDASARCRPLHMPLRALASLPKRLCKMGHSMTSIRNGHVTCQTGAGCCAVDTVCGTAHAYPCTLVPSHHPTT